MTTLTEQLKKANTTDETSELQTFKTTGNGRNIRN